MRLSRFTWRVLLAAACFGAMFLNPAAQADQGACPYVAEQNQDVCPLSQDHCDEYIYDYELSDTTDAPAAEVQNDEADFLSDCPFRSVHDAIYDAEVYGNADPEIHAADECNETITVVHTTGQQSVEVNAAEADLTSTTSEEASATDGEEYYYDGESDLYDNESYEYEAYGYDYSYENEAIDATASEESLEDDNLSADEQADEGQVAGEESELDEYGAYDEYDYDEYYYENYEGDAVEPQSADLAESEATAAPAEVKSDEDAPMPYDEYGYDEYSVDKADAISEEIDYADYWNGVEVAEEASEADLWGEDTEARLAEDASMDSEFDDFWYEESQESDYDNYWADEPAAVQPSPTEAADSNDLLHPVAQALNAMGILPLAELVVVETSPKKLASKLPNAAPSGVAAPCDDECGWEDWDCYYEFPQEEVKQQVVETVPGSSLRHLERQALRILATSIDHAGRTLQIVSGDLMRISGREVAGKDLEFQLK
jgi:hypothetical protein